MQSTCLADGTCMPDVPVPPSSAAAGLNNLPTIIRNDPNIYLAQREGLPSLPIIDDNVSKIYINDDEQCNIYVGESSIPNAGLGVFAGRNVEEGQFVDINPQLVLPLINPDRRKYENSLLMQYPWNSWTKGCHLESDDSTVLSTTIGMLSNSHLGLINIDQIQSDDIPDPNNSVIGTHLELGSRDRSEDYGAGARSMYSSISFRAIEDIREGTELFSDYGENYFYDREEKYQRLFPSRWDYKYADEIVNDFVSENINGNENGNENENLDGDGKMEISKETRAEWEKIISTMEQNSETKRVAYALPKKVDDLEHVADIGTARYSLPTSIRSMEYLKDKGVCLDNLRMSKSKIPHAGNGAFAMTNIAPGGTVAPLILLPVYRDTVEMMSGAAGQKQLLMNYCIGHPNSSLMFVPYSSGVQYLNHSREPNAEIRWTKSSLHDLETILDNNIEDVPAGLFMDVIATKEIGLGEEVTINYGEAWDDAWSKHVQSWNLAEHIPGANPGVVAFELNIDESNRQHTSRPVRTMREQEEMPYPRCIRTACYSSAHDGTYSSTDHANRYLRYCSVAERTQKEGQYVYTAIMESSDYFDQSTDWKNGEIVVDIPRNAIKFVPDRYCNNMHLANAFRHEIHVPQDMSFPDKWLDML